MYGHVQSVTLCDIIVRVADKNVRKKDIDWEECLNSPFYSLNPNSHGIIFMDMIRCESLALEAGRTGQNRSEDSHTLNCSNCRSSIINLLLLLRSSLSYSNFLLTSLKTLPLISPFCSVGKRKSKKKAFPWHRVSHCPPLSPPPPLPHLPPFSPLPPTPTLDTSSRFCLFRDRFSSGRKREEEDEVVVRLKKPCFYSSLCLLLSEGSQEDEEEEREEEKEEERRWRTNLSF